MPVSDFLLRARFGAEIVDTLFGDAVTRQDAVRIDVEIEGDVGLRQESFEKARPDLCGAKRREIGEVDKRIVEIPIREEIVAVLPSELAEEEAEAPAYRERGIFPVQRPRATRPW